ncbi:MAG: hypothetical protein ACYSR0_11085 [Planctomycetota bacterium]|jgi:hypothetical protein
MDKLTELKVKHCDASIQLELAQNLYNTTKRALIEELNKQNGKQPEEVVDETADGQ